MKTSIKKIFLAVALGSTIALPSCSDFLDVIPTDQYPEDAIFSDASLTQAYVFNVYDRLKHSATEHSLTGLTDDAYFTHNYGQIAVNEANVSESDLQWYSENNNPFRWDDLYKGIRYANQIIANIDKVPPTPGYNIERLKGETHFLRAFFYAQLIRGYGGVPIVEKTYGMNEMEEMKQPRNTMKECLEYIVKDCEEAEKRLPETVGNAELGRAVKGAATALKARMLLHVASPLYADRTVNTLKVNQYEGDRLALYRSAKDAALQVINSGTFALLDCRSDDPIEAGNKFKKIILDQTNSEQIFARQFLTKGVVNNLVLQHGPNGYHNWSGTTPTQDLVMSFQYADGKLSEPGFDKVGDEKIGNPYNGREPRFYATVGTDGNEWGRPRPADAIALDPTPLGRLQCGYYEVSNSETEVKLTLPGGKELKFKGLNGIDTRQGPIEDWNGSWTGYYEKKLVDTSIDGQNFPQPVPWTYLRLAEMYLIVAEACVELNELDNAAKYLDILRARISMPDTKTTLNVRKQSFTQESMREFVRIERRSELAFEDSRYFDVRRWMIAPQTNSKPLTGVLVYGLLKPGQTQNKPYIHNEEKYEYHYVIKDLSFREKRKWDNKMYFAPIKRDEIRRNPNLVQNPGME